MSIRAFFAIAGVLITGGAILGLTMAPQLAEARLALN